MKFTTTSTYSSISFFFFSVWLLSVVSSPPVALAATLRSNNHHLHHHDDDAREEEDQEVVNHQFHNSARPHRFRKERQHMTEFSSTIMTSTNYSSSSSSSSPIPSSSFIYNNSTFMDERRMRSDNTIQSRIIGGQDVVSPNNRYSYFVQWQPRGCGGSLIGPDLVLTSAYCKDWLGDDYSGRGYGFVIIGGTKFNSISSEADDTTTPIQINVIDVAVHPKASEKHSKYDFMILKLQYPVNVELYPPLVPNFKDDIPKPNWNNNVNQQLIVLGHGQISETDSSFSDTLQVANVSYITNKACNREKRYNGSIKPALMCAGGDIGVCWADLGGPLVKPTKEGRNDILVGVVVGTWWNNCSTKQHPGIFGRVSKVKWWIKNRGCALSSVTPIFCKE